MKKTLYVLLGGLLAAAILPMTVVAEDIVTDGIVAYYDGANNANGSQDTNATVWKDVSGNGIDFDVAPYGNSKWTDNSFYMGEGEYYFDDKLVELVSSEKYTVELALGELDLTGTSYISYILSENDEFSIFGRVEGDFMEIKLGGNERPKVEGGADLFNNSTPLPMPGSTVVQLLLSKLLLKLPQK